MKRTTLTILLTLAVFPAAAELLTLVSPKEGETVCALKPEHRAFLAKDREERRAQFLDRAWRKRIVKEDIASTPLPVTLKWRGGEGPYGVSVVLDQKTVFTTNVMETSVNVWNLEIAREYTWVVCNGDGKLCVRGHFRTLDLAPRVMYVPNVANIRDLGGRIGLGGRRVRQGLVYRSAGLNNNAHEYYTEKEVRDFHKAGELETRFGAAGRRLAELINTYQEDFRYDPYARLTREVLIKRKCRGSSLMTDEGLHIANDVLRWKSDIDLRSDLECWGMEGSPAGKNVKWLHYPSQSYKRVTTTEGSKGFVNVFRAFLDERNYPIVFHCIAGADRTGTIAFIINALLGVSDDELDKDWEFTCFRNDNPTFEHKTRFDTLRAVVDAYPGATTRERVENFVKAYGFTDADIAKLRKIMLEDEAKWPFIVIRHTGAINNNPKMFGRLIDCHRRHRGACDEFWFAAGGRGTPDVVATECAKFARFRPLCDEVGIALSYQQGLTLGHGEAHDGKPKPGEQTFPDDAWQVDQNGRTMHFLCPRSPDVIAYERAYAKAVISAGNPASYWLDDDLRLGVHKPMGCFCDRCIAAFNAKTGGGWTRQTLVAKLFSKAAREPLRAAWLDFNAESLAVYAAAVRQAADELKSPCRLAYQSVWADTVYTASSYRPLLEALSGAEHQPVGIRPGAGYYTEAEPRGMVKKCLSVLREAERCRSYGNLVASVCYEQETYPRHVLHKSPGAIMTECALALASGCDSLSLYWYSDSDPEPVEEYDRFVRTLAMARPYFERLAVSTRRTRLGGVARFLGSAALEMAGFDLRDSKDFDLACMGIPVTVAEANPVAWYLTEQSRAAITDADRALLAKSGEVKVDDIGKYPLASRRKRLLDDLDRVTGGAFPVRVDACRPLRILPRVCSDGTLDSVTILNLSIGDTDELKVRVRRPASGQALWRDVKGAEIPVPLVPGAAPGEYVATLRNLAGWNIGTLFF